MNSTLSMFRTDNSTRTFCSALFAGILIGAFATTSAYSQTLVSGNDLIAALGDQNGSNRSGSLATNSGELYIADQPTTQWSAFVNVKLTGVAGWVPGRHVEGGTTDDVAVRTIEGEILIVTDEGWLLLSFTSDRLSWYEDFGTYEIAAAGGAYLGASGGSYIDIPANGIGFSDSSNPIWYFYLY